MHPAPGFAGGDAVEGIEDNKLTITSVVQTRNDVWLAPPAGGTRGTLVRRASNGTDKTAGSSPSV